jgi:hypothetical protein
MEVSRRSFLGGALALTAAAQLPSALYASVPLIYGDGVHDDTAGLQAALDGKPFKVVGKGVYIVDHKGFIHLQDGAFKLTDTLHIRRSNVSVMRCAFDATETKGKCVLRVHPSGEGCRLFNCHIKGPKNPHFGIRDDNFLGAIMIDGAHLRQ